MRLINMDIALKIFGVLTLLILLIHELDSATPAKTFSRNWRSTDLRSTKRKTIGAAYQRIQMAKALLSHIKVKKYEKKKRYTEKVQNTANNFKEYFGGGGGKSVGGGGRGVGGGGWSNNYGRSKDYRTECVNYHNQLRAAHNTEKLQYSQKLSAYAQNWAENLARMRVVMHSGGNYGENIYMSYGMNKSPADLVRRAIKLWYEEGRCYNYYNLQRSCETGHFTQVIWRGSKEVGIGIAKGKDGTTWIVTEYYPPGNYHGQEKDNVLPPMYSSNKAF